MFYENLKYEFDIQQKALKEKQQKFLAVAVAPVLLTLFFVLIAYTQRVKMKKNKALRDILNTEKQLLEEKLEFKNKKLMINVMYLLKKNELIIAITNKL